MKKIGFIIIFLAIIIRIYLFTFDKSLWLDEAALALNVLDRNFLELFAPLIYAQSAPPLFLVLVKSLTLIFGNSEHVLRFIPFVASCLSVVAFYYLLELIFEEKTKGMLIIKCIALFLFSINFPLLYYANEFKPYSVDVLCVILSFLIYFKYLKNLSIKREIFFGFLFLVLPLISFGSIFALCSICSILFIKKICNKTSYGSFILPLIFGFGFILEYLFFFKNINPSMSVYKYWVSYFIDFNILKGVQIFIHIFAYYFYSYFAAFLGILLFIAGCIYLYKHKKEVFYPFILMIFGAFLSSFLNIYPLYERLSLFLYPIILIMVISAFGLFGACSKVLKYTVYIIGIIFVLRICLFNFLIPNFYIREDIKPLLLKLQDKIEDTDKIFVFKHSHLAWRYYTKYREFNFKNNETFVCPASLKDDCFNYLMEFCNKNDNCWVIYTTEIDAYRNIPKLNDYIKNAGGKTIFRSGKTAILYKKPSSL